MFPFGAMRVDNAEVHRTSLPPEWHVSVDLHDDAGKSQAEVIIGSVFLVLTQAEMKEDLGVSQFRVWKS